MTTQDNSKATGFWYHMYLTSFQQRKMLFLKRVFWALKYAFSKS